MRRRDFIKLIGNGAVAWPLPALGQQQREMPRVGILMSLAENDPDARIRFGALTAELQKLGWAVGKNLTLDIRWFGDRHELAKAYAKELVDLRPALIVANTAPAVEAVRPETSSIPIVFVTITDPIGAGIVADLARPRGNITGFAIFEYTMAGKWLELLKEIAPTISQVGILYNVGNISSTGYFSEFDIAAHRTGIRFIRMGVSGAGDIEQAIANESNSGLVVLPDSLFFMHRKRIVELTMRHRLPAIFPYKYFASLGGLLSYGVDAVDLYRRAGQYVDRILKGANVMDLPVQQPTKYELVINLKTAKALGLTVPPQLLTRADEVIE